MQKVLLIGYLGRDPEVKYSQQGTAIAELTRPQWLSVRAFTRSGRPIGGITARRNTSTRTGSSGQESQFTCSVDKRLK